MSTGRSGDTDRRYSDICGATNNRGNPCGLPAGWGTPGSGGERCRFHGGASTGPDDVEHLEGNDFATDNPGGGAPELNTNAEIHAGFSDWEKEYDRLDEDTRAYVDHLRDCMRETAKKHAPEVAPDRRERLLKEHATRSILWHRAAADTLGTPKDPVEGARGIVIEETVEKNGVTYTKRKANPAHDAMTAMSARRRQIEKELRLLPGFQSDEDGDEERDLAELLSD